METLDGFILNLFRTEKPVVSKKDFESEDVWVCDLLNQDIDLANEFVKFKLGNCSDRMEKLQFLYDSRGCFKYAVEELENDLNPNYQSHHSYYRKEMTKEQMIERLDRYKKALAMTDQAICFYIDCSTIDGKDKKQNSFQLSTKKGAKTDLIRVLNALYELRLIDKANKQIPTKQEFIEALGKVLGVDLSKYHTNLSQALKNQPLEVNLKVFQDMINATKNAHYTKEN